MFVISAGRCFFSFRRVFFPAMPSIVIQHAWLRITGVMCHPLIYLATLTVNVMSMHDG